MQIRRFALTTGLACLLALAACGSNDPGKSEQEAAPPPPLPGLENAATSGPVLAPATTDSAVVPAPPPQP